MAKQSRGSNRAQNRPATPPPAASSNRPAGQRPASQRPAGQRPAGQKSGDAWQPNRVSGSKSKPATRLNQTAIMSIGAIVVGVLIVAYVALQQLGGGQGTGSNAPIITPGQANSTPASIPTSGRTLGNPNAPVTIDLYGDFRCSACYTFTEMGTAAQIDNQLIATGKAKLVWHDFTIIDHNDKATASRDAANAAWCAADQNKFWPMHDSLYANQSPTEDASAFTIDRLLKIGQTVAGLDMTAFTTCVQNGTHNAEIAAEQTQLPASVSGPGGGTPSVLVNGTKVDATFPAVKAAVDAATPGGSSSSSPAASSASPG